MIPIIDPESEAERGKLRVHPTAHAPPMHSFNARGLKKLNPERCEIGIHQDRHEVERRQNFRFNSS
jgi:hypothetical protein